MRRLIYYVAVSLDGFIADSTGSSEAFEQSPELLRALFEEYPETCPTHVRGALGLDGITARHFDTVLLGARTHQPALDAGLTSAYPHLRQIVVTHRTDLPPDPTLTVTDEAPVQLVQRLKREESPLDLWLCGGGNLAGQLVEEIDELHLKVNPVLLGRGVPLLGGGGPKRLELLNEQLLPGGVRLQRWRPRSLP